ncbi:cmgc protein kinase [Fusarium austroafricanum]|uniref:Cmgc protein kinase n=1 Tax=Fusarium austroafricanum TaxID=2364996 RepID=A0A8H4KDC8_9HYPO|nr:cmgc protein kinase [Fusarium austroafricanum]
MATGSDDADCASVWGDFVGSDDEGEVEDACEPAERYEEGLYYPVCIGEVLLSRYRVEHKLGHGGFSTVWMAHDMLSNDDVALKIMSPGPSGEREYTAQNMIASTVQDTSRLLTYRETFLLPGAPQTYHRVLVFPLLGPSLQTYASFMSIATRRSSAKQLLQAIKALHDAGVVHRDINSANVLYGLAPFNNDTTIVTKYKYLGRPQKMPIPTSRPLWKDGQLVMPIVPHNTLVQGTITLADFGLAVKSGTSVECKVQSPAIYCAPERIHNVDPSFASDMWSYMCIFAELCLGFPLFYGSAYSSAVDFMVKSLGPLPSSWKGSYDGGGQYDKLWYNQDRQPDPHHTLEAKIKRALYDISPVEQQLVLSILQRGLSYSPEDRFSAGQLLEDVSFKKLMAIYRL